ncbi:hypothetical protein [Rhodanobacter sp. MP1X3]|uniref:hypothetical protein n=1 Tax=Rhodanobacter sp. MP1X3 TaxID=2723086 RepID=UPI00160AC09D|nr:hypothetical protein [Rhodanobacter sp. MP1X3]MBB6241804.1 hypothetical protein [Rhodanobacter sp. MP1X3]
MAQAVASLHACAPFTRVLAYFIDENARMNVHVKLNVPSSAINRRIFTAVILMLPAMRPVR